MKDTSSPAREYLQTYWLSDIHEGVERLVKELGAGLEELSTKLDKLQETTERIDETTQTTKTEMHERFDQMEGRIDLVVQRGHYLNEVGHNYPKYLARRMLAHPLPEEKWEEAITAAIDAYIEGKSQLATLHNLPAEYEAKRKQAFKLFEEARLDEAAAVLDELIAAQTEKYEQDVRDRAQLWVDHAAIARAALDFDRMLTAYESAAKTIAPVDPDAAFGFFHAGAKVGYDRAEIFGEPEIMEGAARLWGQALGLVSDPTAPDQPAKGQEENWAMTQNHLGNALRGLGERGDEGALARAVAAYEKALTVRTREAMPADWAMTQNNLGNVFMRMGEGGKAEALERAVEAFEAALEVRTREEMPREWAKTQHNLGLALQALGERGDEDALGRAVKAYEAALEVRTREAMPAKWAMTNENLGNALWHLGDKARAEKCYCAALDGNRSIKWHTDAEQLEANMRQLGLDPEACEGSAL